MAQIKVYAQDLAKICDWTLDDRDNTPDAIFLLEWAMSGAKYPTVKISRDDVDGGGHLNKEYDIEPEQFFTEDLPAIKEANAGFDETTN